MKKDVLEILGKIKMNLTDSIALSVKNGGPYSQKVEMLEKIIQIEEIEITNEFRLIELSKTKKINSGFMESLNKSMDVVNNMIDRIEHLEKITGIVND